MIVQVCIGSSCHIKGAPELVEMLKAAIEKHGLSDEVTLAGSFCMGRCNRVGVTIQVDDETVPGVTRENFFDFFQTHILGRLTENVKER